MFELPELVTLARQANEILIGKTINKGSLGNIAHKFVWYNKSAEEFEKLTSGKVIGKAWARGKWLFIPLEPGHVLLFGECGGKMLFHSAGSKVPKKYHLILRFDDGSFFTATTQMWGAMELYTAGEEQERKYIKGMKTPPDEPEFTLAYLSGLVDSLLGGERRSVKGLLTQDQLIPGLGNASAQDILFRARLHPKHSLADLNRGQRQKLYQAILKTIREATLKGGRYDEYDLHGQPGRYIRLMDSEAVGRPCPGCGGKIEAVQYLGGKCYFCPHCQV
jgi:formamidopyrimidine-DNA glycosylase